MALPIQTRICSCLIRVLSPFLGGLDRGEMQGQYAGAGSYSGWVSVTAQLVRGWAQQAHLPRSRLYSVAPTVRFAADVVFQGAAQRRLSHLLTRALPAASMVGGRRNGGWRVQATGASALVVLHKFFVTPSRGMVVRATKLHESSWKSVSESIAIMKKLQSLRGVEKAAYFDAVAKENKANVYHCNSILASCSSPRQGRDFLLRMHDLGIKPDAVSYTSMMQLETKTASGSIGAAEALFKEMKTLDPPLVTTVRTHLVLIEGHGKRGRLEDAVAAWQRMLEQGVQANEYIYTALIDACAKRMDVQTADRVLDAALEDDRVKPNMHMFTAMIDMNARAGRAGKVKSLWTQMLDAGIQPDTAAVNSVISALDKSASLDDVIELSRQVQAMTTVVELDCTSYRYLDIKHTQTLALFHTCIQLTDM